MATSRIFYVFRSHEHQHAAHDFLHPKHRNCSVSLDLQLSDALTANLKIFVLCIRSYNVFIISDSKVTKNERPSEICSLKMDGIQFQDLIQNCKHLKYKFFGVFATDNFPPHILNNAFTIVNTSMDSDMPPKKVLYFADPLGL